MTIVVTCLGHIKTSIGRETVELDGGEEMTAQDLIERLRQMGAENGGSDANIPVGFTKFNTLLVVNDESAFTATSDNRRLRDGDRVLLIPFSHGG